MFITQLEKEMSNINTKVLDITKKINMFVGGEGYEEHIVKCTSEFLESLSKSDNERRLVFDFITLANGYDVDSIIDYMVKHAYPTELLELGMSVNEDGLFRILEGFTLETAKKENMTDDVKRKTLMFLYANAFKLWPHADICFALGIVEHFFGYDEILSPLKVDRLLAVEFILNRKIFLPGTYEIFLDEYNTMFEHALSSMEWNIYAKIFLKYPALINVYNEEYDVKEILGDASEENHRAIEEFVTEITTTHPMDVAVHSWIIGLFNNSYMLECFNKESNNTMEALSEMDFFKKMSEQPQPT